MINYPLLKLNSYQRLKLVANYYYKPIGLRLKRYTPYTVHTSKARIAIFYSRTWERASIFHEGQKYVILNKWFILDCTVRAFINGPHGPIEDKEYKKIQSINQWKKRSAGLVIDNLLEKNNDLLICPLKTAHIKVLYFQNLNEHCFNYICHWTWVSNFKKI